MRIAGSNLSPNALSARWESTWRLAGLSAAVVVNLAWIGLLAYGPTKLL